MTGTPSSRRADELPGLYQLAALEPLSTGDLIDRAVYIYRHNFAPLLGLSAIPVTLGCTGTLLTAYIFTGLQESAATLPVLVLGAILGYSLTYLISPLFQMLITGGLTRTVADFVMLDIPISFWRTWRMVRNRLWPLIVAQLVGYILFGTALAVIFFVGLFASGLLLAVFALLLKFLPGVLAGSFAILLLAFLVALGFVGYCAAVAQVALIPSVVMIEGRPVWDSIARAIQLAQGTIWRVVQITLFTLAITSSAASAVWIPFSVYVILNGDFEDITRTPTWFVLAFNVANQLGTLLTLPLTTITYCLLYFDMRVRQEGYDIELLCARLESTPIPAKPSTWVSAVNLPRPVAVSPQTKTAASPS
jgi:hypothetical protein